MILISSGKATMCSEAEIDFNLNYSDYINLDHARVKLGHWHVWIPYWVGNMGELG